MKSLFLFGLLLAACGTSPDARPVTFEVVVTEVLGPSCGAVQCHSTTTNAQRYALDTIDAARASMKREGVNDLLEQIRDQEMPPDAPMAMEDIALFQAWIDAGKPGL